MAGMVVIVNGSRTTEMISEGFDMHYFVW